MKITIVIDGPNNTHAQTSFDNVEKAKAYLDTLAEKKSEE